LLPNSLLLWLIALLLLLQGCSSGYAPVSERSLGARSESKGPAPSHYRVRRGDTLYSISFRYGLDYREVARWNGIDERYFIYPGQTLTLRPNGAPKAATKAAAPSKPRSHPPATAAQPASDHRAASSAASRSKPAASGGDTGPIRWQWPHTGRIIARFGGGEPANKGIDLAGKAGDPVKAAASGEVVYAGNGLLGYGNLVILNHDQRYLSAYAHNSRIFVREGDKVKAGEKIAEVGSTGTTRAMLHFEIRRDGNPVDPLRYLPKQ
jgi:lipoprotein NlpD